MAAETVDLLVLGAGFAGAATAFHLASRFDGSVLLVEQEETPGAHASGRNASLLHQAVDDPVLCGLLAASRDAYLRLGGRVEMRTHGSLLLGQRGPLENRRQPALVTSEWVEPEEARRLVPVLSGLEFEAALFTPTDCVIEPWDLLSFYLEGARAGGARLLTDCRVTAIAPGRTFRVRTTRGEFEAGLLVDATGAWASPLARLAGLAGPELVPFKRHLLLLDVEVTPDPAWPFVWNLLPELYFRPESGGLLFSICDEEPSPAASETVTPGIEERVAEVVLGCLPALHGTSVRRVWACCRTRARDHRFVIGEDPRLAGFYWVAGLGGHGMGASWEVGRLAAGAILGIRPPEALSPNRLLAPAVG